MSPLDGGIKHAYMNVRVGRGEARDEPRQAWRGFSDAEALDWSAALTVEDLRGCHGELRFISILPLSGRLHVCVWTQRGEARRIISLRKANTKEAALHARAQELH